MKKTLRFNMILWIWGVTTAIFLFIFYLDFIFTKEMIHNHLEMSTLAFSNICSQKFEDSLSQAETIPQMIALSIDNYKDINDNELRALLETTLKENPYIYGTYVAFAPYYLNSNEKLFAPYYYNKNGSVEYLDMALSEPDYIKEDWFVKPQIMHKPLWQKPYYDKNKKEYFLTYSVPFYKKETFGGVAAVDISIIKIIKEINENLNQGSIYSFVLSNKGDFIAYNKEGKLVVDNITKLSPDLAGKVKFDKSDFLITKDPVDGKNCWVVYSSLEDTGMTIGVVYPESVILSEFYGYKKTITTLTIAGLLLLLLVIILISNSISKPFAALTGGVQKVAAGELDYEIPDSSSIYEASTLAGTFNLMTKNLKNHIEHIKEITANQERIAAEINAAAMIQKSLIPSVFPENEKFGIYGRLLPAKDIGGDFYNFITDDKDKITFFIGDVSGKGIPAAIFAAFVDSFIRAEQFEGCVLEENINKINRLICSGDYQNMFVTLLYGVLDTSTGKLKYINAGHSRPIIYSQNGDAEELCGGWGPALGINAKWVYKADTAEVRDGILVYTDGVTDAINKEGDFFSKKRLMSYMDKLKEFNSRKTADNLIEEIFSFSSGSEQFDDIAILTIELKKRENKFFSFQRRIKNSLKDVSILNDDLSQAAAGWNIDEKIKYKIRLAADEILNNIISYAYKDQCEHDIYVSVELDNEKQEIRMTFKDDGIEFNPLDAPEPDINAKLGDRSEGKLGIYLVKKFMDDIRYKREDNYNILILRKMLKT